MHHTAPRIQRRDPPVDSQLAITLDAAMDEALSPLEVPGNPFLDLEGMSGWRYRLLINALVRDMDDARYLEIGVWAGSTLCSAIADNEIRVVAIDDWSQFGGPRDTFLANVERFRGPGAEVRFIEADFRNVDFDAQGRFNLYVYDGPHEAQDQFDAIALAMPALDDEFVLVVDDWNWAAVRAGTYDALREHRLEEVHSIQIRTTMDDTHPDHSGFDAKSTDWHNGYYLGVLRKAQPRQRLRERASRRLSSRARRPMVRAGDPRVLAQAVAHADAPDTTEALALVTHHHVPDRLDELAGVIEHFASWPSRRRVAIVVTNTSRTDEIDAIRRISPMSPGDGFSLEVVTAPDLAHPHDLPWAQKPLIVDRFLAPTSRFTHLVSVEDDLAVTAEAFLYWLRYRPLLAPSGLIPSFLRVESRKGDPILLATDVPAPVDLATRPAVGAGDFDFVALDNPYSGMFIMDRGLAEEYRRSQAFHQGSSMATSPWRTRERAAMGLCFESPPNDFPVRHVVPVEPRERTIAPCAYVRHLTGNYAEDPYSPFASIPAKDILR